MDAGPPIVVGISGASGAIYGVRMLEALGAKHIPAHLIISKSAAITLKEEVGLSGREGSGPCTNHVSKHQSWRRGFVGIIPHGRHDHRAVLDLHAVRHSLRHDRQSAQLRRRRYA